MHMQFAGKALASKMARALEHLAVAPVKNPDFNVFIWDDVTTKTIMPPMPWANHSFKKQSSIINMLNTQTMYATYNAFTQILKVYDATCQTAFFWVLDAHKMPPEELSAPLRDIFHWFLMHKGAYLVHAGAVGTPSGGILLAGKGGAGKSTTVLNCLNSELLYASDDYTLVTGGPNPTVYSLYSSAKLRRESLSRVPHAISAIINLDNLGHEKAIIFLNRMWKKKLISQFPLRAFFLPHVTGNLDTTLSPATTKDAIHALLLSTVFQLPQTDPHSIQELIKIVRSVPSYHLNLGTQMEQIPQVISRCLKKLETNNL